MKLKHLVVAVAVTIVSSCAPMQRETPIAPNFIFTPPTIEAATKNSMAIAILMPERKGSFFVTDSTTFGGITAQFFDSARADLEKTIISKGFTSAGAYPSIDEMTFSQKERSSLIMRPQITLDVQWAPPSFGGGTTATVNGVFAIEFLEPMSREKVWVKRFELPATTQPVTLELARGPGGDLLRNPDGSLRWVLSQNSTVKLLNSFYDVSFHKIWDQLDSREISALKSDAQKLKGRTNYRG